MHYLAVAAALQAGSDQAFLQIGQAVNTPIPFASIIERAAQIMPQCFALAPAGFALFGGQRVTDERQFRQYLGIAGPQCCADFNRGSNLIAGCYQGAFSKPADIYCWLNARIIKF